MVKLKPSRTSKHSKIYYGWIIVLVAGLASISQTSYYGPVIGSFIRPMTEEFHWTRSQFVGALSAGGIAGGVAGIFVGPLLDKYGSKWIMFVGSTIMGAILLATAFVHGLVQFYIVTITAQVALSSMVSWCFDGHTQVVRAQARHGAGHHEHRDTGRSGPQPALGTGNKRGLRMAYGQGGAGLYDMGHHTFADPFIYETPARGYRP